MHRTRLRGWASESGPRLVYLCLAFGVLTSVRLVTDWLAAIGHTACGCFRLVFHAAGGATFSGKSQLAKKTDRRKGDIHLWDCSIQ